ncbi:hypothetical protein [Methylobacterium brachythecii]|uniref:Amino acid transporter protein n=1 Tax=Methylobacterium brachythecii TaxID=1176177 RepID=A0A7W6ALW6_9HYPH|nr:hypothetical protein [Methylobacterium brachythecii]MBB3903046.1 hypothetical protein [Methylobacterium brachythecii]GLS45718.1 hypothetical protein GCM10007884_37090 [Methylobacterium brachythecii]
MSAPSDNAAYNEQTKLLATGLNNVAVAFIVIGVVTPITAVSFGVPNAPPLNFGSAAFALLWFGAGTGLHWVGRNVLRSIRP